MADLRICPECSKEVSRNIMHWTKDRYGNPFKLVCCDCYEAEQEKILEWEFDPSTGENLESDY